MPRFVSVFVCLAVLTAACSSAVTAGDVAAPTPSQISATPHPLGTVGPSPSPHAAAQRPSRFEGTVSRIGPALREVLTRRNWHPGCPVALDDLRVVRVSYWNFRGDVREGPLVLHETVAEDVLWVFRRMFRARFPIHRIALARKYRPPRPEDYWHNRRNVTASFNCRPATGSTSLSHHSYGWAVDINPLQNPYVTSDGKVLRNAAKAYVDRSQRKQGMILPGSVVVRSFARIGWEWGGDWHTLKDYMHFSLTGR